MDKITFIRERTEMGITKPFICLSVNVKQINGLSLKPKR